MSYNDKYSQFLEGELSLDEILVERGRYLKQANKKKTVADLTELIVDGRHYFVEIVSEDETYRILTVYNLHDFKHKEFDELPYSLQKKLETALELDICGGEEQLNFDLKEDL